MGDRSTGDGRRRRVHGGEREDRYTGCQYSPDALEPAIFFKILHLLCKEDHTIDPLGKMIVTFKIHAVCAIRDRYCRFKA